MREKVTKIISFFEPKEYILTCDNNNAKYVFLQINKEKFSWLLDTGASLSAVNISVIPKCIPIYKDKIVINGIGGKIYSEGYVYLNVTTDSGKTFKHKFYIFEKLPCRSDGILGQDFFNKFNTVQYDLKNSVLTLHDNENKYSSKLYSTPKISTKVLTIPARSESIHYIHAQNVNQDCVILPRQLQENILLASTIVTPKENIIPIKILNTSNQDVEIPVFTPELDFLHNYEICTFEKNESSSSRASKLFSLLKLDHIQPNDRETIQAICAKYADIFQLPGDKLTTTNVYEQSITLKPNTKPVYTKQYRIPNSTKSELENQIKGLIKNDIIEECQSEWSSPILLVPKKSDNSSKRVWRLVIDYRKLNEKIMDDKFPLPNINEILDSLSGAVYFSHLDLSQSYYQVTLAPESRNVTAFTTNTGQYQMKRLPMGLKISPSAFSRVMTVAMSGLTYEKCFVYLDDLVIFGRNLDSHNKNLQDVFERLRKVNLKLNPQKCQFLKLELLYLGHVVSKDGVLPDPKKISVIKEYPVPQNSDDVKRFVAFCNYYRKFIKGFAEITVPLNQLCRKNIPFVWTTECEQSFQELKNKLVSPPILQYPNFSEENEFILQTDASGFAIGAVLCNKDLRPVAYASRPLNKAEKNYPTIQKELLAVVWGTKYFRPYLFGRRFTIMTDHKPLIYLFSMKDPNSRLLKFRLALEEYDYKIVYVKGKNNAVADALSRVELTSEDLKAMNEKIMAVMTRAQRRKVEGEKDDSIPNIANNKRTDQPRVLEILRIPNDSVQMILAEGNKIKSLKQLNKLDVERECFALIKNKNILYINLDFKTHFTRVEFVVKLSDFCKRENIENICIIKEENNALFIKDLIDEIKSRESYEGPKICILRGIKRITNDDDIKFILNDYHLLPTSGHAGVRRMINNIKRKFYWPTMEKDVREYVRTCKKCQEMKHARPTIEPMVVTTTATSALEKIFLDLVGPLDKDIDGNIYILTLQCELSKYIEAYPLVNKETKTIAQAFVKNFILRFGIPKYIATDRGTEFMSSTMTEVCKLLGIEKLNSTAYHHQTIGSLENAHKHLGAFLRIQCDKHPETWSHWLPYWCFSYNNTVHTATKYAPYELVFGKHCEIPSRLSNDIEPLYNIDNYSLELRYRLQVAQKEARESLIRTKEKRKSVYDRKVNPVTYKKDDQVLVKNETGGKLDSVYEGPYTVIEDIGPNVIVLKNNKKEVIHKNRTKHFYV